MPVEKPCRDCKHSDWDHSWNKRFCLQPEVRGEDAAGDPATPPFCVEARVTGRCGKDAKYFEPRTK